MGISSSSLAFGVGSSVKNVQFQSEATNIDRQILIFATYDPSKTDVTVNEPALVLSAEDAGSQFGFGFMAHRLALQAFEGSESVPTYVMPQAETDAGEAASGSIVFAASGVTATTLELLIAGESVDTDISTGASAADIADAVAEEINDDDDLPVSAVSDGIDTVTITSKSTGPWGNYITVAWDETPDSAITATITALSGGTGTPDVEEALDCLGTGDDANEDFYTDIVHGYLQDETVLDAFSAYCGEGNDFEGLYSKTVSRPFRVLTGDTTAGTAGLTAMISLADERLTDRTNGVVTVPGSLSHPSEIAAQTIGHMARVNMDRAAQHYLGIELSGIDTGDKADRWNSDYANRDLAVKSGVGTTRVQNGVVTLQNIISFYRPSDVPVNSNGYRSMRNISILQNILYNIRVNFEQERWQGISIVDDTTAVTNITDRQKARDTDAVRDDLVALAESFESKAWIYTADFTIEKLAGDDYISVRSSGNGFDCIFPIVLSGEGGIFDIITQFDTSLAVLL